MKKLLMLGTSKGSYQMVEYANSQGIYTIVTDPRTPEESQAKLISNEYWMIDTSNIDELEKKCKEEKVDGICCGISTFCIPVVMELCKRLNLPTYCTPEAWHYTMDKYDFKKLCRENHVPVAKDYFVSNPPTFEEIEAIEFPVVVKAVDQSANRGMSYCYKYDDIIPAINYAHTFSKNNKVVIEKMLYGMEYTAYYALAEGEARLVCLFSDLAQPGTPGKCYALNSTACDKLDLYLEEVHPFFINVIKNAGLKEGVCWIELMLDKDGHFYVIEMGYRMTGDMMAIPIKDVYGFDSYKWLVDIALGIKHTKKDLPLDQSVVLDECGCSYILWSYEKAGVIEKIDGLDEICSMPGISLTSDVKVGDEFTEHQYLFTFSFTRSSAEKICELIEKINNTVYAYDKNGNDVVLKYTDFSTFKKIYNDKC